MTFELIEFTDVKLANVNTRIEKHGTDSVPALDLSFVFDSPNSILTKFNKDLLASLYHNPSADQGQENIEGVEATLPNVRFPSIAPLKWDTKHPGYELQIDYGLGGARGITLETTTLCKFVLDCKEGGTVEVKFQVQCQSGLTEKIMGKLAMLNGQETSIKLIAPTVAVVNTAPKSSEPEKDAGALFAESQGVGAADSDAGAGVETATA